MRATTKLALAASALASVLAAATARAQDTCASGVLANCTVSLQALASAFPQVGILAGGGNPVPGIESTRGVTLGIVPRTTASLRVSVARVSLPDLREGADGHQGRSGAAAAVRLGTATRLFGGAGAGPVAGIGALDLLLEGGLLPAGAQGTRTAVALGAGARIGIVRESFGTPGVALSAMYRHVGRQEYGRVCPFLGTPCEGNERPAAAFALNDLSARLTVGKRVGPVGLLGGAGWDRFATDGGSISYVRDNGLEVGRAETGVRRNDSRWSVFGNVSYALIVGSLVAEGGWMGGGDAVPGYPTTAGFDPGAGTVFGSVALRLSL